MVVAREDRVRIGKRVRVEKSCEAGVDCRRGLARELLVDNRPNERGEMTTGATRLEPASTDLSDELGHAGIGASQLRQRTARQDDRSRRESSHGQNLPQPGPAG